MFGQILSDWARGWWWTPLKETYLKGRLEWEFVSCKSRDYFGGIGPLLLSTGMRGGQCNCRGPLSPSVSIIAGGRGVALVTPAGMSASSTSSKSGTIISTRFHLRPYHYLPSPCLELLQALCFAASTFIIWWIAWKPYSDYFRSQFNWTVRLSPICPIWRLVNCISCPSTPLPVSAWILAI